MQSHTQKLVLISQLKMQPKCGALKKILVQEEKREKHYDQTNAHTRQEDRTKTQPETNKTNKICTTNVQTPRHEPLGTKVTTPAAVG